MDYGGCDGREGVVVIEFDFGDGEGVVFVDDGDDVYVEEFVDCFLGVEVV